jgi:hypothetical protein
MTLVDSSHLRKLDEVDFTSEDGAETLDSLTYMDLLECLDIDEAFNILTAGS